MFNNSWPPTLLMMNFSCQLSFSFNRGTFCLQGYVIYCFLVPYGHTYIIVCVFALCQWCCICIYVIFLVMLFIVMFLVKCAVFPQENLYDQLCTCMTYCLRLRSMASGTLALLDWQWCTATSWTCSGGHLGGNTVSSVMSPCCHARRCTSRRPALNEVGFIILDLAGAVECHNVTHHFPLV